jgi:uncharacterized protein (DUF924 family)
VQRGFFYLPFEHAEDLAEQETCLKLCKPLSPMAYDYAIQHHAIIEKFGRFPHRNEVLGSFLPILYNHLLLFQLR